MKKILPLLFLFVVQFSFAQNAKTDSLINALSVALEDTNKVDILNILGERIGWRIGDFDTALYYANTAMELSTNLGYKKGMANAYNIIGTVQALTGDNSLALENLQLALDLKIEIGDKKGIAWLHNNLGIAYDALFNYPEALKHYSAALNLHLESGNKRGIAGAYSNIGRVYLNQSNYPEAITYFLPALEMSKAIGIKDLTAGINLNIGTIYLFQGNYFEALNYFYAALKIVEEIGDKHLMSYTYHNIGLIYEYQGNYTEAMKYYLLAVNLQEEMGDKKGLAGTYIGFGILQKKQGNYAEALKFYQMALKIHEEIYSPEGKCASYVNIGNCYKTLSNYPEALENYFAALEVAEGSGKVLLSGCYVSIGSCYGDQKNYGQALTYCNNALSLAQEAGAAPEIIIAARQLFKIDVKMGDIVAARKHLGILLPLLKTALETNFFTLSENEKNAYFQTLEEDYELCYDLALHHQKDFPGLTDTSYNIALQNKGLTLKSSTGLRQAVQNSGDTSLINIYDAWLSLKKDIANTNEKDSNYNELVSKATEMERELVKKSNAFSDYDKVINLKWQDVQINLKSGEAAIEFVHFKSEIDTTLPIIYAALIIKKDSKHPDMVKLCTENDLSEILGVLQGNNLNFVQTVYGTRSNTEKALYQKIWLPVEPYLEDIKTIYYSPTGLLHKISFAAIRNHKNMFLCNAYELRQQNSTGKVALPDNAVYDSADEFLLMGGVQYNTAETKKEVWSYLPGTQKETESIQAFLEKKKHIVHLYKASEASETNFKDQAKNAQVLHISTHGFFYPDPEQIRQEMAKQTVEESGDIAFRGTQELDSSGNAKATYANWNFVINSNPLMRSGLVMSGANDVWQLTKTADREDGILTAQEVSTLDLHNTKLVVLSACETGLGDIKGSEGVFGLQRAFKMAGVKYIMMSLWQVPDKETSEFMQLFYQNLIKLKDFPKAFSITQQMMSKKYDPYFWAAFILVE